MACFLPSCPLPAPAAHASRHAQRKPPPRASAAPPNTAPCLTLPAAAGEILDPSARAMLSKLSLIPLQTSLCAERIPTTHVSHSHPTDAPAMVFLHGFDSNLLEFRKLHDALAADPPARLHYLDVLGWGLTHRPQQISYGPAAKREHLRAFLEAVEPNRPVVLVGASLGAAIAADFALRFPEMVSKLVLIDGQVFIDRPKMPVPKLLAEFGAEVLRSDWLRDIAVRMTYERRELRCEDVRRIGGLHCGERGWKHATVDFIMGEGYCVSDRMCQIRDKSFVLWGERDRVLPKSHLQRFRNDGFPVIVAKGCGHSPHLDDPQFVADYLRNLTRS